MRKVIATALLGLLLGGCAKNVMVPPPPNYTPQLKAVMESDLPAAEKKALADKIIEAAMEQYRQEIARLAQQGMNIRDAWVQLLALAGTAVSITLTATK